MPTPAPIFTRMQSFEHTPPEARELLSRPIRDLGLRLEGSMLERYVQQLYGTKEWLDLFGPFDRPYAEDYRPLPFSRKYVRHIAGWYAQKHPDEDFAESFAVWLTPGSDWKRRYAGWPALRKLQYVD